MAYADYTFYTEVFLGDSLTEEHAGKWLERASDALDALTFARTRRTFPTEDEHAERVKKAVCAIAEALALIDAQERALTAALDADGNVKAAVASLSSGRESVSYVSAANGSAYASAARDRGQRQKLLFDIAAQYLADVPDREGVNLLYAGVG